MVVRVYPVLWYLAELQEAVRIHEIEIELHSREPRHAFIQSQPAAKLFKDCHQQAPIPSVTWRGIMPRIVMSKPQYQVLGFVINVRRLAM